MTSSQVGARDFKTFRKPCAFLGNRLKRFLLDMNRLYCVDNSASRSGLSRISGLGKKGESEYNKNDANVVEIPFDLSFCSSNGIERHKLIFGFES